MTEQWIRAHLPLTDEGEVLLQRSRWGGTYSVPVETMARHFTEVAPAYEAMLAHDQAQGLGYTEAIERWHAEGRI